MRLKFGSDKKAESSRKNMRRLWETLHVAEEMGKGLGRSKILQ